MHFLQCKGNLSDSFTLIPFDQYQPGLGDVGAEGAGAVEAGADAFPPKILNMTVPQVGHLPLMALRPFFMTSSTASTISFFALHLTQYPSGIKFSHAEASCGGAVTRKA
jgi:hypothetical protein